MAEESSPSWGESNFKQGLAFSQSILDLNWTGKVSSDPTKNYLYSINKQIIEYPPNHLKTYPENTLNKFISDGSIFYFILKSNSTGAPSFEKPFVIYSDSEKETIVPIYSSQSASKNWIDYHVSWNTEKEVNFFYTDNYRIFMVLSKETLEQNMNIQVCNLYQSYTMKPLTKENVVYVIGKTYNLNGVNYYYDKVDPRAYYNLTEINVSTSDFVNIVYFEKK